MSKLYVVATPIGNLEDITLRALRVLREVDWVACEDTRHTRILLAKHNIDTPTVSYHQHSRLAKIDWLVDQLKAGKSIALVSDAGTPGINDPGGQLVAAVRASGAAVEIVPIPGANAGVSLLSVSGWPADQCAFLGYLPKKKGRQTLLKRLPSLMRDFGLVAVFYESPHRLLRSLEDLGGFLDGEQTRVLVGRELTKRFEEIWQGSLAEASSHWAEQTIRGEFVVALTLAQKSLHNFFRSERDSCGANGVSGEKAMPKHRRRADRAI